MVFDILEQQLIRKLELYQLMIIFNIMKSTIYLKCPQCREHGLLIERQGRYFCANCMYDYTQLKDDPGKLDDILIDNLGEGGFGFGFTTALYERVTLVSPQEATEYITKLASDNNIELIPSKWAIVKGFAPFLIFLLVIVVIIIIIAIYISIYG